MHLDSQPRRIATTLFLLAALGLAWHGGLDRSALGQTDVTFTRALATYAIARGLNGVISVAQGTEIAVQPVGVGMTITIGEILDPLNDLVERFSWLALVASASLGTQALLTDILSETWMNVTLSGAVAIMLIALWVPAARPYQALWLRIGGAVVLARFLFVATSLVVVWADDAFLAWRQAEAMENITQVSEQIAEAQDTGDGWFGWMGESAQARVDALQSEVERTIGEMINLMVVFIVQTLLVPVGALFALMWLFRQFWQRQR